MYLLPVRLNEPLNNPQRSNSTILPRQISNVNSIDMRRIRRKSSAHRRSPKSALPRALATKGLLVHALKTASLSHLQKRESPTTRTNHHRHRLRDMQRCDAQEATTMKPRSHELGITLPRISTHRMRRSQIENRILNEAPNFEINHNFPKIPWTARTQMGTQTNNTPHPAMYHSSVSAIKCTTLKQSTFLLLDL